MNYSRSLSCQAWLNGRRTISPVKRPVIKPFTVEPTTIAKIIGRASGENHADNPSSSPRTAPRRSPSTGLLSANQDGLRTDTAVDRTRVARRLKGGRQLHAQVDNLRCREARPLRVLV